MRTSLLILFFASFFCFGSGYALHKRVESSSSFLAQNCGLHQKQNNVLSNTNLHTMIAAQAELFLVEESCNTDEAPQTFFPAKSDVLKNTYTILVETIIVKDNSKGFNNFQSYYGHSQPIYISQKVLRI
ncbi:MAG: hypothetical protein K2Y30_01365 [Flavobacteriaceae bacterium]|jgi:hypothetical protein|nr:hypothetical protein [Flavobacteriaceae bacterium]